MSSRDLVPIRLPVPARKAGYRFVGPLVVCVGLLAAALYLLTQPFFPAHPTITVAASEPQSAAGPAHVPIPIANPAAEPEPPALAEHAGAGIPVLAPLPPVQGPVPAPGWKLAAGTPPSLTTGSINRRVLVTYINRDIDGRDYRVVRDTSLAECQRSCQSDSRCEAYTFNTWHQVCFLKASATVKRIEPRGISGVLASSAVRSASRLPTIQKLPLQQFPDRPYTVLHRADYDGCARQCVADPLCLGFNFTKADGSCALVASLARSVRNETTDAGMKWQPPIVEGPAPRRRAPAAQPDLPPNAAAIFDAVFSQILR